MPDKYFSNQYGTLIEQKQSIRRCILLDTMMEFLKEKGKKKKWIFISQ